MQIGLVNNGVSVPEEALSILRPYSSAKEPRINPSTIGAGGI